jgi:hypothetical protein
LKVGKILYTFLRGSRDKNQKDLCTLINSDDTFFLFFPFFLFFSKILSIFLFSPKIHFFFYFSLFLFFNFLFSIFHFFFLFFFPVFILMNCDIFYTIWDEFPQKLIISYSNSFAHNKST